MRFVNGWTIAAFAAFSGGCPAPGLSCGPGTVEKDGECVVVEDPDDPGDGTTPTEDGGDLIVVPAQLELGTMLVPCDGSGELTVTNASSETRRLLSVALSPPERFALDTPPALPFDLPPGGVVGLTVRAVADAPGELSGTLTLVSDAPEGDVVVPLAGTGAYDTRSEALPVAGPAVDLLLAIDHSCSMASDNTDDVEQGIGPFLGALDAAADWQLIEVTRESGCANGGVVTSATPNAEQLLVDHAWDGPATYPTYLTEALLELSGLALSQTGPGQCNEGFLRPGAQLHVVVLSDEPEQSGRTWQEHLSFYETFATDPVISAIIDVNNVCGEGASGYLDAAQATGGVVLNICNASWGQDMERLADVIRESPPLFVLDEEAIEGTVVVTVGGAAVDFEYDPATSTVSLADPLPTGTVVDIAYAVLATCTL